MRALSQLYNTPESPPTLRSTIPDSILSFVAKQAVFDIWNALCRRDKTGPMTMAPTSTPITSAVC